MGELPYEESSEEELERETIDVDTNELQPTVASGTKTPGEGYVLVNIIVSRLGSLQILFF